MYSHSLVPVIDPWGSGRDRIKLHLRCSSFLASTSASSFLLLGCSEQCLPPLFLQSPSATSSLPLFGSGEQQLPRWLLASSLMDCNISFQSWASSSSPFLSWSTPSAKIIFIGTFCPSWSSNEAASTVLSLFVVAVLLPSSDHLLRRCCAQSSLWWSFIRRFNPSPRQAQQMR